MGVCADPGSYRWCQALSRSRSSFATNTATSKLTSIKTTTTTTTTTTTAATIPREQNIANTVKTITNVSDYQIRRLHIIPNKPKAISATRRGIKSIATPRTFTTSTILETLKFCVPNTVEVPETPTTTIKSQLNCLATNTKLLRVPSKRTTTTNDKIFVLRQQETQQHQQQNICHWLQLPSFQILLWILFTLLLLTKTTKANNNNIPEDAVHITAILGEGVIFNCHVEFPNDHPVPYVLQWDKKVSETGSDLPIYIWYESYPEHIEEGYKGRVSRVSPDSPFGSASLNLTNIKESDQGWYECKVVFLNRDPKQHKNGTWFHLDVHAPPRFSVTPEDIIYVNLGDSIILNCQADGTPTPEILWYKDANPVDPSPTVGIFNDGTELRISTIRHEDIGEYTCIARNGEGQVSHTARVIIAGGAVIMVPPTNQTKLEGEKVIFSCEAKAMPGNVTVRWFREGSPVREVASLETRITIRKDGSLIINPISADDSGQYLCEVTNGIGDPQSASAYLNVEYAAKVTFTPTVQYLPFRLAGVVQCYIKSNPQLQYVTWTKDKRLLEPYQMKDIVVMANGSLLFTRVNEDHQGRYTCTPYNALGTQGSSGPMEVLVRKPPTFTIEPESLYQRKVGDSVEMHCDAVEAEGTQKPIIKWQRQDGGQLSDTQRSRVKISGGNITIENLRREDFGYYQCVVSNEVATLMSQAQLVIEGTQPHAPYNITGKATESSITLQWMPGYSGGSDYKQDYTIWYREAGVNDWQTISVTPSGSTQVTINGLASGTTYEFQVVGRNVLGDGMMSKIMTVRTLEDAPAAPRNVKAATQPPDHVFQLMPDEADLLAYFDIYFHTDSNGSIVYSPPKLKLKGPKPGPPRNLTVTEVSNGFLISWQAPLERAHIVKFYTIKYRTDAQWKTLNRGQIRPEETQYLVKNLVGGRTYYFRVLANSEKSYESSDEVKFPVPARVKHKAITAGVVGGILFFIVAIILSVCAVKICNKRKRRKQEKEFNMVACRITDARNIAANNHHHHRQQQHQQHHHQHQSQQQQQQQQQLPLEHQLQQHHQQQQPQMHNRNTGSISACQVPLKKYKETRVSSLTTILIAILHWIWPPDRCNNCHSIYSSPHVAAGEDVGGYQVTSGKNRTSVQEITHSRDSQLLLNGKSLSVIDNMRGIDNGIDEVDDAKRNSTASSSSDDGGFLSRRNFITARASWRRPLVASPSQLSLQSAAAGSARGLLQGLGGLLKIGANSNTVNNDNENTTTGGARYQNVYQTEFRDTQQTQPANRPLHINTISGSLSHHMHHVFSPSKVSRIFSSSPASTPNGLLNERDQGLLMSPWALTTPPSNNGTSGGNFFYNQFNDLSSVHAGSAERSMPTLTPTASGNLSRYRYYSYELPALRTIEEETRRMNLEQQHQQQQLNEFVPLQIPSPPSWRSFYQHNQAPYYHSYRPRTRWYPRHYSRLLGRPQAELMSPLPHLNLTLRAPSQSGILGLDASPESRSSSSGFGSKNTSNQPQGSHHSGSTSEWRLLPPYRPPPPPPASNKTYFGSQPSALGGGVERATQPQQAQAQVPVIHNQQQYHQHYSPSNYFSSSTQRTITPPYTMEHWLDMITRLNNATDNIQLPKSIDVGSVDGHYEFDPSTPTPSISTPTGGLLREDLNLHIDTNGHLNHHHSHLQALHNNHDHHQSQHYHHNHHHHHHHHTLGPISNNTTSSFHGSHPMNMTFSSSATLNNASMRKTRLSTRYDNVETRLQAMKEEFYEYRKRQAMQRAAASELETIC
ncbi:immunoglobulin superfamily member turtle isoform 3-T21 [Glossina fuscipes fuscipes]